MAKGRVPTRHEMAGETHVKTPRRRFPAVLMGAISLSADRGRACLAGRHNRRLLLLKREGQWAAPQKALATGRSSYPTIAAGL